LALYRPTHSNLNRFGIDDRCFGLGARPPVRRINFAVFIQVGKALKLVLAWFQSFECPSASTQSLPNDDLVAPQLVHPGPVGGWGCRQLEDPRRVRRKLPKLSDTVGLRSWVGEPQYQTVSKVDTIRKPGYRRFFAGSELKIAVRITERKDLVAAVG